MRLLSSFLLFVLVSAKAFSLSPFSAPVAAFSISDSSICTGTCISFTDLSLNAPTAWSWTFNGATPSSSASQSPANICYNSPGTYTATLVVSNSGGSDTAVKSVIVSGPPNGSVLRFQRAIGTLGDEETRDIRQTVDDGYIIAGYIDSSGTGTVVDAMLVKTDETGIVQWSKSYGGTGNTESFNSVRQTSDNGYFANGYTDSFGAGNTDAYAVKTDATGTVLWSRTFGGSGADDSYSGQQTADGGYIIAGSYSTTNKDLFLVKMDSTGTKLWTQTVGGTADDGAYSVQQTKDHGYIAAGYTYSTGGGGEDVYLVKTDSVGTVQWTKSYGGGGDEYANSVQQTTDGGYILTGKTGSMPGYKVFLIKTDSLGDTLWTRGFKGDNAYTVQQTTDAGYAVVGWYNGGGLNEKVYLLKLDSSGNFKWAKAYEGTSTDLGYCGRQTADGGYIVSGATHSFGAGYNDIYLIKTDSVGSSGCHETTVMTTQGFGMFVDSGGVAVSSGVQTNVASVEKTIAMQNALQCMDSASIQTAYSICQGTSATLNAFGGNTYSWSPATGLSNTSIPDPVANPTVTTVYTLTIFRGPCSITKNVTVAVRQPPIIVLSGDSVICIGGFASLSASGAVTYSWSTGSTASSIVVSPATTTTYTVTGTDSTGCSNTKTATVTVNTHITVSIIGDTAICLGQTDTLTGAGGSTYSWSTGATTQTIFVNPTLATTYTVVAVSGTCIDSSTITVTIHPPVIASISNDTSICKGQSVTLTASGGSLFLWNTGDTTNSITVTPLADSLFYVFVSNGVCADSVAAMVTVIGIPTGGISNDTAICQGQSVTLSASGGTLYTWSTGATTSAVTVNPAGTITYSVIVSNGTCFDTATVNVAVDLPVTAGISNNSTICSGQSVLITASGGTVYSWSTGDTTFSITVSPGTTATYSVTVSSGACFDTASVNITVIPSSAIGLSNDTAICQGQSVTLTATGGTIYLWSTGATTSSIAITPANTLTYSIVVSNGSCADTGFVQIAVASPFTTTISNDTTICQGPVIVLSVTGGNQYVWSNGGITSSISVTPSVSTTYSVIVSNGGCFDTASVHVTVNATPVINISRDTTVCRYQTVVLTASGGTTYLWSNGATTNRIIINPAATTTLSVVVSNGTCSDSASVTATVNNVVGASITGDTLLCKGQSTTLNAIGTGIIYYYWITGDTSKSIAVAPSITTDYWVWVSNGTCIDTARIIIDVNSAPVVTAGNDTLIIIGHSVTLNGTGGPSWNWTPATGLSCTTCPDPVASPVTTTTYVLTVSYSDGCSNSASVTVNVDVKCGDVFVPSAFSPNGDGENDMLKVENNCIKTMSFIIYDRWGEKIFESDDVKDGWDGTYKGKSLNSAVFIYYLDALLYTGETVTKKGSIHLIR